MIKSKRQFPDLPHFASLIEWKLPSIFRTRTKLARALTINDLAKIAKKHNLKLVVDNTFSPLSVSPAKLGADIVIHSLTKYINGSSDTVGGVTCASKEFINSLKNVNSGACMLLGPTMDSLRSSSILKRIIPGMCRLYTNPHYVFNTNIPVSTY